MSDKTVTLTEKELDDICGQIFDIGYYAGLYQGNTVDNSIKIYNIAKTRQFNKLFAEPASNELFTEEELKDALK